MNPSLGTGSTLLGGGTQALQEAMARRQTGQAGATAQQTPASPGFQQMPQSPTSQAPQPQMGGQPMSQDPTQQAQQPATPQTPYDPAELKIITSALINRQKLLGGLQEALLGIPPKGK